MEKKFFNDLMTGLQEATDHQNDKIQLDTTIYTRKVQNHGNSDEKRMKEGYKAETQHPVKMIRQMMRLSEVDYLYVAAEGFTWTPYKPQETRNCLNSSLLMLHRGPRYISGKGQ